MNPVRQLVCTRVPLGSSEQDWAEALAKANAEIELQTGFWRRERVDYHGWPAVIETEYIPKTPNQGGDWAAREMREVGAATYPDIEFTHYQCLRAYDSRGEKGGMYSHVDENVFTHATSGIHESAHNFLNRRHSGVYGSGPSGAYNDYLGSVLASSAQGWRRLGLNVADRVRGRLITATNYTGPGIYRIGRLEAHPASRVDGEIAALMLPRGTHNLPLYLSPRKTKACPYPLPAAFDDTLFVHEIEPDGQSWRHPMLKPGTHELINGMSINFTGIEDECAVVEVLA